MTPSPRDEKEPRLEVREETEKRQEAPRPWTAPDFVERSTCAEIGAYAFQDK